MSAVLGGVPNGSDTSSAPAPPAAGSRHDQLLAAEELWISPRAVTRGLILVAGALVIAHAAGQFSRFVLGRDSVFGVVQLFSLSLEQNVPTWFSSVMLLICAGLLAVISRLTWRARRPFGAHWAVLAAGFTFMSLDETIDVHAMMKHLTDVGGAGSGFTLHAWVVPAAIGVGVLLLSYWRFLAHLPARIRWLFCIAGATYVGGAVGMESVSGKVQQLFGSGTLALSLASTAEEVGEMAGVLLFVYALLSYIASTVPALCVRIGAPAPRG